MNCRAAAPPRSHVAACYSVMSYYVPTTTLSTRRPSPQTSAPSTDREGEIFPRRPFRHHLAARSALIEVSSPARSRATMYMPLGRSALALLVIAAAAHRSFRTRRSECIPWHPITTRLAPTSPPTPLQAPPACRSFALYSSRCTPRPPNTPLRSSLSRSTTSLLAPTETRRPRLTRSRLRRPGTCLSAS